MRSSATTVSAYLKTLPADRRRALSAVRKPQSLAAELANVATTGLMEEAQSMVSFRRSVYSAVATASCDRRDSVDWPIPVSGDLFALAATIRQAGRDRGANVIDMDHDRDAIAVAVRQQFA